MRYDKVISELQMQTDQLAYTIVTEREFNRKMAVLQCYCDFPVALLFGTINWYREFQDFVYSHGEELKRKLTIDEFFYYGMRFRIVSKLKTPSSFEEFKKIKIKPIKN